MLSGDKLSHRRNEIDWYVDNVLGRVDEVSLVLGTSP